MTISRTLLFAFLGFSLFAATLATALAYTQARATLRAEISGHLRSRATTVMRRIDALVFERVEDTAGWSRLEVMQEARINDVDKRLALFLASLQRAYGGFYRDILFTIDGRVVASARPVAGGNVWRPPARWRATALPGIAVDMAAPDVAAPDALALRVRVTDAYSDGVLGDLVALVDWTAVLDILDQVGAGAEDERVPLVVLLDDRGRVLAASAPLRDRGLLFDDQLAAWSRPGVAAGTFEADGSPIGAGDVLIGHALSGGYHGLPGIGWQLLLIDPVAAAFRPVRHLLAHLVGLLLLTTACAAMLALVIARRVAGPITALTAMTRRFRWGHPRPPVPQRMPGGEVGELTRAFIGMIESLDVSREQLVRAAKLATVGEMAAVMAHEVRTPLGIIKSSAQLLGRDPALGGESREMVEFVLSETERLNRLVSLLLECARPRPPRLDAADLRTVAERAVDLLAAQAQRKGVSIGVEADVTDTTFVGDAEQLLQVAINLVLNAIQVLPAGGRVRVRVDGDADRLVLEVADDGPGVPLAERAQIFEPFVTHREGGIGLGLTVVQQIVRLHRGEVTAGASEWGGACFRVTLPRSAPAETAARAAPPDLKTMESPA